VRWIVEHALGVRLEVTGTVASRCLAGLLTCIGLGLILFAVYGSLFEKPYWALVLAIVIYMALCLALNLVLLFVRHQRREREAVRGELDAASEVQRQLLPAEVPRIAGYELAAHYAPAREVAGDYYDVIELGGGRWVVVIADVSDKGLPAGLLMTMTKGHLTARLKGGDDLVEALAHLNREVRVSARGRGRMFVTMCLVELDASTGTVRIARAGHEPPLLVGPGDEPRSISPPGITLGLDPGDRFAALCQVTEIRPEPGETLLLVTDGVTEARREDDELYGDERLRRLLAVQNGATASDLVKALATDVESFRGRAAASDDVTIVAIRRVHAEIEGASAGT
jgi:sigma-B regulation protein RsbU (phosphoserine phosphatase)